MKSGIELLKYMTQRTVTYFETPKEIRKQLKRQTRQPWGYRWFGMVPLAIQIWMKSKQK